MAVTTPKVEAFYWAAITFSQTLGTALGDWIADDTGLGYEGGALVFAAALLVLVGAYFWTNVSRVLLFWAAFILTRPLGVLLDLMIVLASWYWTLGSVSVTTVNEPPG